MIARTSSAARPLRARTRAICSVLRAVDHQDAVGTRLAVVAATRRAAARHAPRRGRAAAAMRRSRLVADQRVQHAPRGAFLAAASANTSSRMRCAVHARPSASDEAVAEAGAGWPESPPRRRAVSSCAMASVSTTVAPSRANSSAAALLPLPMPPVRPDHVGPPRAHSRSPVPAHDRGSPQSSATTPAIGEVGSETESELASRGRARRTSAAMPNGSADERRQQDHERQHLPAEPGADRGEQLEVAVAHALLAGGELEAPVHDPQREVAGGGADHRRRAGGTNVPPRLSSSPAHSRGSVMSSGSSCVSRSMNGERDQCTRRKAPRRERRERRGRSATPQ